MEDEDEDAKTGRRQCDRVRFLGMARLQALSLLGSLIARGSCSFRGASADLFGETLNDGTNEIILAW